MVYQREPHARQLAFEDIAQPTNMAERCALAERTRTELDVTMPVLVDDLHDQSRGMFGDLPSPVIVINPDGIIVDKLPWADPAVLGATLEPLFEGRAIEPPDLTGTSLELAERSPEARDVARCARLIFRGDASAAAALLDRVPVEDTPANLRAIVARLRVAIDSARAETVAADDRPAFFAAATQRLDVALELARKAFGDRPTRHRGALEELRQAAPIALLPRVERALERISQELDQSGR